MAADLISDLWVGYLRRRNRPVIASATPMSRCHDAGSRKNTIPAMAIIAAPPARIAGTAESRTAFLKEEKESNRSRAHAANDKRYRTPVGSAER